MPDDLHIAAHGHVRVLEIRRPPYNYFDLNLIRAIADGLDAADADPECRAVVLAAEGKAFCAGADFAAGQEATPEARKTRTAALYHEAERLFSSRKPIVAAIQGAAIGGGLGLALAADFRIACPEARFSANFTRLGFHPGFGLTVTLPDLIGDNRAALMFLTSRRITGEEALAIGLVNQLVSQAEIRSAALALAAEIAECAPLALISTRATLRAGLAGRVARATEHELQEQSWLRETEDFREGVKSSAERRPGNFLGR
ncbi:enoyl-CoA hydratase/isomerase family protein [Paracoccus sp. S1E-3]|uniref:enoyl-CoA hydratase/isomerase family protein n=1 Tax=Paracoccus sp. S1E-3 TaxID=2756130 RepID=UPI0015EF04EB|nr:enoyl-CoA hydratase/isomerase family protein [Paracoccus sp. S1E-3]MBA4489601.1 enoyl-CoA hydratase/isomerase family protein [Paracoccus sp. S1E-3]